jgi:hypothetical protein
MTPVSSCWRADTLLEVWAGCNRARSGSGQAFIAKKPPAPGDGSKFHAPNKKAVSDRISMISPMNYHEIHKYRPLTAIESDSRWAVPF